MKTNVCVGVMQYNTQGCPETAASDDLLPDSLRGGGRDWEYTVGHRYKKVIRARLKYSQPVAVYQGLLRI